MKLTAAAAFFCLFVIPDLAAAGDEWPASQTWLGLSMMDFQYKEFSDQGELLNREDGLVPGLRFALASSAGNLLIGLEVSYQTGSVDYDGQLQNGTPHKTRTDETFIDASFTLGRQVHARSKIHLGAGYHQWDRDIQPSGRGSGLFERYAWIYVLLGGEQLLWKNGKHQLSLNAQATYPVNPTMTLNFTGSGNVSLDLGSQPGFRLQAPWRIRLASGRQLEVTPYYEYWQLGRSPDVRVGAWIVHEPRSETGNLGITLSLGL